MEGHVTFWLWMTGCGILPIVWEPIEAEDLGSLCLSTVDGGDLTALQDFDRDRPIRAVVGRCFSGSCARDVELTVERLPSADPQEIHLGSTWDFEQPIPLNGVGCTDDCRMTTGEADLGALPDGVYTVRYGEDTAALTIPSTDRVCLGGFPYGQDADTVDRGDLL